MASGSPSHDPSDALRALAEEQGQPTNKPRDEDDATRIDPPHAEAEKNPDQEDEVVAAEMDDDEEAEVAQPAPTPASAPARRTSTAPTKPNSGQTLQGIAIPLLITVGLGLWVPGAWAILQIGGVEVWGHEREDARTVAFLMLLSWPVSICLLAGAGWFFMRWQKARK